MAFAVKYRLEFKDLHGVDNKVEILYDGYAGSVIDLTPSANPVRIEYLSNSDDVFDPIRETRLNVSFIATTNFPYSDLYSTQDQEYKVNFYHNTVLHWSGWIMTDFYEEPYDLPPYEITIKALDGLNTLKTALYKYTTTTIDDTYYDGRRLESQIILDCLGKIGFTEFKEYVNLYENDMDTGTGDSPCDQVRIDVDVFKDMYCWEVLREVLAKYNACIRQKNGVFCIYRPVELKGTTIYGRHFTAATTKTSVSISAGTFINRSGSLTNIIQVGGGKKMIQGPAKKITLLHDTGNKKSWIENYEFKGERFSGTLLSASGFDAEKWTKAGDATIYSVQLGLGERDGVSIASTNNYPTYSDYIYQSFAPDALESTTDVFVISFDYLLDNRSAAAINGNHIYIEIKADGASKYLYEVNAGLCAWSNTAAYIDITADAPLGSTGWVNYTRRIVGIPTTGNYTIKLIALDQANPDLWLCYKNIQFYTQSITSQRFTITSIGAYVGALNSSGGYDWRRVSTIPDLKMELIELSTVSIVKTNALSGTEVVRNLKLGDIIDADIDNILEQFAGSLSVNVFAGYVNPLPQIDYIDLMGSSGTANIHCNGLTKLATFNGTLATTAGDFIAAWAADYAAAPYNVTLTQGTGLNTNRIICTSVAGSSFTSPSTITPVSGTLDGEIAEYQEASIGTPTYTDEPSAVWNTRGGSEADPLLDIMAEEIKTQYSRPKELIQMNIQEGDTYGADTDFDLLTNYQDSLNTIGGNNRKFAVQAGEWNVVNRRLTVDLIELI